MDQNGTPKLSLVRGGIFYRFERKIGLITEENLRVGVRALLFVSITWLPIVVMELIRILKFREQGVDVPTVLTQIGMHTRLLFAGPLLILCESWIDRRVSFAVTELRERKLVPDKEGFTRIIATATRLISGRPAIGFEIFLLFIIVGGLIFGFAHQSTGPLEEWKVSAADAAPPFAMKYYYWVGLPFIQFLQARWIWRFSAWLITLRKISRMRLNLEANHPDASGGIAFLSLAQESFAILWLSLSAIASGSVATRVISGSPIATYYIPIAALVAVETFLLLAPLMMFTPKLAFARLKGVIEYGKLSSHYVHLFHKKWITDYSAASHKELLGSADFQSLADLAGGFEIVDHMRLFPAKRSSVIFIVMAGLCPFLPLVFLVFPVKDVVGAFLQLLL